MYVEIKENKLLSWCENPYSDYEFVEIDYSTFDASKYEVIQGVLTDISQTQEYKDKFKQNKKTKLVADLTNQINELDIKRIRAIAEPRLKDAESGQTWLDFYTAQIKDLRTQLEKID